MGVKNMGSGFIPLELAKLTRQINVVATLHKAMKWTPPIDEFIENNAEEYEQLEGALIDTDYVQRLFRKIKRKQGMQAMFDGQ
jgi:hypothetical protein